MVKLEILEKWRNILRRRKFAFLEATNSLFLIHTQTSYKNCMLAKNMNGMESNPLHETKTTTGYRTISERHSKCEQRTYGVEPFSKNKMSIVLLFHTALGHRRKM